MPDEVCEFFEGEPDPNGIQVNLDETACCREWSNDYGEGYEIEVANIPSYVTHIRVYNAW